MTANSFLTVSGSLIWSRTWGTWFSRWRNMVPHVGACGCEWFRKSIYSKLVGSLRDTPLPLFHHRASHRKGQFKKKRFLLYPAYLSRCSLNISKQEADSKLFWATGFWLFLYMSSPEVKSWRVLQRIESVYQCHILIPSPEFSVFCIWNRTKSRTLCWNLKLIFGAVGS